MKHASLLASLVVCSAIPNIALADTHACVEAAHEGQRLRDLGNLHSARNTFLQCAADECPAVVRESCQKWGAELEPRVPTVVFAAHDGESHDMVNVRVTMDGKEVTRALDGHSVAVDPGPHEFVFEAEGFPALHQSFVVREGEKMRTLTASFRKSDAKSSAESANQQSVVPLVVSGAVAAVGVAGFTIFGLMGKSDRDALANSCAPTQTCASSDVSAAQTKWIVADVSLAVGVIGAGVFTTLLVLPMFKSEPQAAKAGHVHVGAAPTKGGAAGSLSIAF